MNSADSEWPINRGVIEIPDTGWASALAAVAHPHLVRRAPRVSTLDGRFAILGHDDGAATRHTVTPEILDEITDAANEYLAALGLPPRPPGFRWVLIVPEGTTRLEFERAVNVRVAQRDLSFPQSGQAGVDALRDIVRDLLFGA